MSSFENSTYWLFLDDERFPADWWYDETQIHIVRTYDEFVAELQMHGCPEYISFDHDLGDHSKSGMDCAHAFVNMIMDGELSLNPRFSFTIHSQNPVGAENIFSLISQFLIHYNDTKK